MGLQGGTAGWGCRVGLQGGAAGWGCRMGLQHGAAASSRITHMYTHKGLAMNAGVSPVGSTPTPTREYHHTDSDAYVRMYSADSK